MNRQNYGLIRVWLFIGLRSDKNSGCLDPEFPVLIRRKLAKRFSKYKNYPFGILSLHHLSLMMQSWLIKKIWVIGLSLIFPGNPYNISGFYLQARGIPFCLLLKGQGRHWRRRLNPGSSGPGNNRRRDNLHQVL